MSTLYAFYKGTCLTAKYDSGDPGDVRAFAMAQGNDLIQRMHADGHSNNDIVRSLLAQLDTINNELSGHYGGMS